jgi:hypothetical protein
MANMKSLLVVMLLLFKVNLCYPQGIPIPDKPLPNDSIEELYITSYLRIKTGQVPAIDNDEEINSFVLKALDRAQKSVWTARCYVVNKEKNAYIIKANIPQQLVNKRFKFKTIAVVTSKHHPMDGGVKPRDLNSGTIDLSIIELTIKSTPIGAEVFLIPNRVWKTEFDSSNYKTDFRLDEYKVNTSSTNTLALIDETVYVVIYKLDEKYKIVRHFTKPASIQKKQTVFVELN